MGEKRSYDWDFQHGQMALKNNSLKNVFQSSKFSLLLAPIRKAWSEDNLYGREYFWDWKGRENGYGIHQIVPCGPSNAHGSFESIFSVQVSKLGAGKVVLSKLALRYDGVWRQQWSSIFPDLWLPFVGSRAAESPWVQDLAWPLAISGAESGGRFRIW